VKQDVVPGRATTIWFEAQKPGRYPIYCAEYCGTGHSTMRAEVVVLSGADYEARVADLAPLEIAGPESGAPAIVGEQSPAQPLSLAAVGQRVAARRGCLRCHTLDGTPHIGPTWAGLYRAEIPLAGGGRTIADEAYLTESMMEPLAKLHLGFLPVMPSYRGFLSAAEVGALVELIRTLGDRARAPGDEPLPRPTPVPAPLVQPLPPAEQEEGGG
jgi:cytochrome c oxidase subunit 2